MLFAYLRQLIIICISHDDESSGGLLAITDKELSMTPKKYLTNGIAWLLLTLNATTSYALQPSPEQSAQIKEQKEIILQLAEKYRGDNSPGPRAELEAAVDALLAMTEQKPIEERIKKLPRAWEQVYGPTSYGRNISITLDPNRIYQVVMKDGYYYNVGYSQFLNGRITTTGLLRGEYQIKDNALSIKFTKNLISLKNIPSDIDLVALARLAEHKNLATLPIPLSPRAREAGMLSEDYIDDTLRITHGGNLDNPNEFLYVLKAITLSK